NAQEAANSDLRCVLTRSLGKDPTVPVDFHSLQVNPGDIILQCCDGVHACMSEQEMLDIITRNPELACQKLKELCERRGSDDNISVQVIHIRQIERVTFYRGMSVFQTEQDPHMGQELQIDQILDGRYQII